MRIFVVKDQKSISALKGGLIRADASTADVRVAKEALQAANPQIDINRLKPGTVLVVPDTGAFDPKASEHAAGEGSDEIGAGLKRQLDELGARLRQRWAEAEQGNAATVSALKELMPEAKRVDANLVKILDDSLKQQEQDAATNQETRKQTDAALRKATTELKTVLGNLLPKT